EEHPTLADVALEAREVLERPFLSLLQVGEQRGGGGDGGAELLAAEAAERLHAEVLAEQAPSVVAVEGPVVVRREKPPGRRLHARPLGLHHRRGEQRLARG